MKRGTQVRWRRYLCYAKKEVITANDKTEKMYKNLFSQIDKIRRHNRQGSFKTKERYYNAVNNFCRFAAETFGLQKFANVRDKHLEAYVEDMHSRGLSASTVKTNLSAIRFYYDKSDGKNILSGNEHFDLEKRRFGGVNRAWTDKEYKSFLELCVSRGQETKRCMAILARNEGLRIHESCRLDRSAAEKALASGILHIKGKGGKERDVPLSAASRQMLEARIKDVERGQKLFVKDDEKTHLVIKQVQNYINSNRSKYQDPAHVGPNLTYHGLRHLYAKEQYISFARAGKSDIEARRAVSELLGHFRDDVTRIYLAK